MVSFGTDALLLPQESCECDVHPDGAAAATTGSRQDRHDPCFTGPIGVIGPGDGAAAGPGGGADSR